MKFRAAQIELSNSDRVMRLYLSRPDISSNQEKSDKMVRYIISSIKQYYQGPLSIKVKKRYYGIEILLYISDIQERNKLRSIISNAR